MSVAVREYVGSRPVVGLAVAVAAVSTSAPLVELSAAPSSVKAFYRVLFMTCLVAPVALRRSPGDFRRITGRDMGLAVVAGVALAAHFALWFASIDLTTIAASATLVQTQPLFVAVGAWLFLRDRVTRRTVAGIVVAVVGAALIGLDAGASATATDPLLGNVLAVVAAAMAAGYVLAGRSLRQRIRLFPYVTVVYGACTVVLFATVVAEGHALLDYPPREYALFLAMAVGPGIFGHTVINWLLDRVESAVVSVSLLGEPLGSAVLALALFAEVPGVLTVVGGAIALVGIAITVWNRERDEAGDDVPRD
ncbi:DMT family transporter [Haloarchaeobius iranensis]|uniref:Permease of the drug/metabolite transporter (DMT) superfamily n=1 Tax=Haloarchaeobius iranensis TaxID=996166 RepID=A0A1G9WMS7_9EURY|nr:DMT family transporter [Haloarchaeobius iranensis]SDM85828.1 Permease of the drug/metabolite transporter (DMT) superfamily [Haloarchaeobius iranensis]